MPQKTREQKILSSLKKPQHQNTAKIATELAPKQTVKTDTEPSYNLEDLKKTISLTVLGVSVILLLYAMQMQGYY